MPGRNEFSNGEIDEIRAALRELRHADQGRQKTVRSRLRRIGFYITDYSHGADDFTVSDFDEMLGRRTIRRRSR
jgi:Arc/MetJ-type ribon-helix-helix transcriptional regulator